MGNKIRRTVAVVLVWSLVLNLLALAGDWPYLGKARAEAVHYPNLAVNGGFETGDLSSWSTSNNTGMTTMTVETAVYHSGSKSVRLNAASTARGSIYQRVNVAEDNGYYEVSVWVKTSGLVTAPSGDPGATVRVSSQSSDNTTLLTKTFGSIKGTADWTLLKGVLFAPAGTAKITVDLFNWNGAGTIWYDDLTVRKTEQMIDNGDMGVLSASGLPSGWSYTSNSGVSQAAADWATVHSAVYSVRMESSDVARRSMGQSVFALPGTSYQMSYWVKTDQIASADAGTVSRIQFYDGAGAKVGTDIMFGGLKGTHDWTQMKRLFTTPAGTARIQADLFIWNSTGTAWFDDVELVKYVPVTGLALDSSYGTVNPGESLQLNATVSPAGATDQSLLWISSNPAVASVVNGLVTGLSQGAAKITAVSAADENYKAHYYISVGLPYQAVTGVSLNPPASSQPLAPGESLQLEAVVAPPLATVPAVTWSSSNPAAATVSADGKITAVAEGDADITATTEEGGFTAVYHAQVRNVLVTELLVDQSAAVAEAGLSFRLNATVKPENATHKNVVWTSSNPQVATVAADGTVKAIAVGEALITAAVAEANQTAEVPVTVAPAQMLGNGSFETVTGGSQGRWTDWKPSAWDSVTVSTGNPVLTVDSTEAVSGSRSLKIMTTGAEAAKVTAAQILYGVQEGEYFKVSGWIKTKDITNQAFLRAMFMDSANATLARFMSEEVKGSADWAYFERLAQAPANAHKLVLDAYFNVGTGTAWFDDLKIMRWYPVTGIMLDRSLLALAPGQQAELTATVAPANANVKTVEWHSSDPSVAIVSGGTVTAVGPGTATISAVSTDGRLPVYAVVAVGDAPSVLAPENLALSVPEDEAVEMTLPVADASGRTLSYRMVSYPANGVVTVTEDGRLKYTPRPDYSGSDAFAVAATDGSGGIGQLAATVAVTPVNDAPAAELFQKTTVEGQAVQGAGNELARDKDGDALVYTLLEQPAHGGAVMQANGDWSYTPAAGYTGLDILRYQAEDGKGGRTESAIAITVGPSRTHAIAALKSRYPEKQHPRLMADASDFARMRTEVVTNGKMRLWYENTRKTADDMLKQPTSVYGLVGTDLLQVSRTVLKRLQHLGMMYQLTDDRKYAERGIAEMNAVADFPDWNPFHFLDTAEMTHAMAIGYDWLYSAMTDAERVKIREAIRTKGLLPALEEYNASDKDAFPYYNHNWNAVGNGGSALGALAVGDETPELETLAGEIIERGILSLPTMMKEYAPDGGWHEGPTYWDYGTTYVTYYLSGLATALGGDYGLSDFPGFADTVRFPIYTNGIAGTFNFADSPTNLIKAPQALWFAARFNRPEYAAFHQSANTNSGGPLELLWYNAAADTGGEYPLDHYFRGVEAVTMRSQWNDPYALFAGLKGGVNGFNHADLDIGSFVLDANGARWASDLGVDSYNLAGYFDLTPSGTRWLYYRKRAEGHNTIVVNPGAQPDQNPAGTGVVQRFESSGSEAMTVIDMSQAYGPDVISATRGMSLIRGRSQVLLQDEIKTARPSEMWWFMHTPAQIEIAPDGKSAILTQLDKRLYVALLGDSSGVFRQMAASPLPTSMNPSDQGNNEAFRKLAIRLEGATDETLSVWMVPLLPGDPVPANPPQVRPLQDWTLSGETVPLLGGITVNGAALEGFSPTRYSYEVAMPGNTVQPPLVAAVSGDPQVTVLVTQAGGLPGFAKILAVGQGFTTTYTINFNYEIEDVEPKLVTPQELSSLRRIQVQSVTASGSDPGFSPDKSLDMDLAPESRWTSSGEPWIEYDLGSVMHLDSIAMAFYLGNQRQTFFDIMVSNDRTAWRKIFTGASSGKSLDYDRYDFTNVSGRYIRIYGHGNQQNNYTSITEAGFYQETDPPVTAMTVIPANPGPDGWYSEPVTVQLQAEDAWSGVAKTEYSLDGGATWKLYGAPVVLEQNGEHSLLYRSVDYAGNEESVRTAAVRIARPAPETEGEGGGDEDISWSGSVPVPVDPAAAARQTVSKEELAVSGGKVGISLASGKSELLLPAEAANLPAGTTLEIKQGNVILQIPAELLQTMKNETGLAGKGDSGAGISLFLELAEQLPPADPVSGYKPAGPVLYLELAAVMPGGERISYRQFREPVKLLLPLAPGADPALAGIYALSAEGKREFAGGEVQEGLLKASLKQAGRYAALEYDKRYTDVPDSHWAYSAIRTLSAKHVVDGVSGGNFMPSGAITRAQFAAILVRAFGLASGAPGELPFADVPEGAWYAEAVAAAAAAGIVEGVGPDRFAPEASVTREQMAVMLVRAFEAKGMPLSGGSLDRLPFTDAGHIHSWAERAVSLAVEQGWLQGKEAQLLDPQATATRAESAMLLYNALLPQYE